MVRSGRQAVALKWTWSGWEMSSWAQKGGAGARSGDGLLGSKQCGGHGTSGYAQMDMVGLETSNWA